MSLREALLSGEAKLGIFGTGYIGLSSACWFSKAGVTVVGTDIDKAKVEAINRGIFPMKGIEPVLPPGLWDHDKISVTTNWMSVVGDKSVKAFLVAIPTERNGEPWWTPLRDVINKLSQRRDALTIIESTLSVGTCDKIVKPQLSRFAVAPRRDWFTIDSDKNLRSLPRIVGGADEECTSQALEVLSIVCDTLLSCSYREAELCKAYENLYRFNCCVLAQQLALAYPNIDVRKVLELGGTKWNVDRIYPNLFSISGYCLAPRTLIATNSGHKPIEQVKQGDLVLSDGGYTPVLNTMQRQYSGELVGVKLAGIPRFWITPEHPVLTNNGWIPINGLTTHSLLASPKLPSNPLEEFMGQKMDYDLGRLLGWYAAEGSATKGHGKYEITLAFGRHESQIAGEIADLLDSRFGCPSWYHDNNGHLDLRFGRKQICNVFTQLIGEGAAKKRLSQEVLAGPADFKRGLLDAWTQGDGLFNFPRRGRHRGFSISFSLIEGLQMIADSLGFPAYVSKARNQGVNNQGWNCSDMWQINWREDRNWGIRNIPFEDGRRLRSTRSYLSFQRMHYTGLVYNLHTANNSYAVYDLLVHNCLPLAPKYVLEGAEKPRHLTMVRDAIKTNDSMAGLWRNLNRYGSIACLGLAYKGGIKVHVLSPLVRLLGYVDKARVWVHDPLYSPEEVKAITGCESFDFPYDLNQFEAVLLLTDHKEYGEVDKTVLIDLTQDCKMIFDNTGLWQSVPFHCPYYLAGAAGWQKALR